MAYGKATLLATRVYYPHLNRSKLLCRHGSRLWLPSEYCFGVNACASDAQRDCACFPNTVQQISGIEPKIEVLSPTTSCVLICNHFKITHALSVLQPATPPLMALQMIMTNMQSARPRVSMAASGQRILINIQFHKQLNRTGQLIECVCMDECRDALPGWLIYDSYRMLRIFATNGFRTTSLDASAGILVQSQT